MAYRVVLSPSARAELRDIVRYISLDEPERDRLNRAENLVEIIRFWHAARGIPEINNLIT